MKKTLVAIGLCAVFSISLFAQTLPRLAVVEFSTNRNSEKVKEDAITVREIAESLMDGTKKYQIIAREEIDRLLAEQRIAVSSITSDENLEQLKIRQIKYIVTGTVGAIGDEYAITVKLLDVSTGEFTHIADDLIGSGSRDLYNGLNNLMAKFTAGISADERGAIVRSGIVSQPSPADIAKNHFDTAEIFRNRSEWDIAILEYTEAIRFDPNHAKAFNGRGISYDSKRDYDQAIADYTQAIRFDPNYASAYNNRGDSYYSKGDYDRAITDYTQAIRLDPNYALAYKNRGDSYNRKSDYDRAIADYTQSIKLEPNYASAYNQRGNSYDSKGDYDRAIADYTEAIRLNPNTALYYNMSSTKVRQVSAKPSPHRGRE